MSENRNLQLGFVSFVLLLMMANSQCTIATKLDRLADTADAQLCIEAAKAGIDPAGLKQCKGISTASKDAPA